MSVSYNALNTARSSSKKSEPLNVDWADPDAIWVYKRLLFEKLEVEVKPSVFVPYRPHVGQMPVHFPEHGEEWEVFVAAAGQRAGKSITAAAEIAALLGQPGQRIWIVAPNYDLTRRVYEMVHEFVVRQKCHGLRSVKKASSPTGKESLTIKMQWGSWVSTKTAENADSLVGEKLSYLVLDEAAQVGEEIWLDYLEPRLVNLNGKALLISSPRGHNWFWKYHRRGKEDRHRELGWRCGHFKTEDNPFIDKEKLRSKKLQLPKLVYQQEYEGLFVSKQGLVYDEYRDELFPHGHLFDPEDEQYKIDPAWTHYLAVDIGGRHPTGALWCAVDPRGNRWYYQEYHEEGLSHQNHARAIATIQRYPLQQGWISVDAARSDMVTDRAITPRHVYAEAGLHLYPANRNVDDGVSVVKRGLIATMAADKATTNPRIFISKELLHLRKGVLSYMWQGRRGSQHEDTKSDLPTKPRKWKDEMVDALRYLEAGQPRYIKPLHYTNEPDYDPRGFEGTRMDGNLGQKFLRPGEQ